MHTVTIDLDDLIMALSARFVLDDPSHYLDMQSGEVIYAGEGLEALPPDLVSNTRYRWIEPISGENSVAIMDRFLTEAAPGDAVAALQEALAQEAPLEAFMEALGEPAPAMSQARDAWIRYQQQAHAELAQGWCLTQGIVPRWR